MQGFAVLLLRHLAVPQFGAKKRKGNVVGFSVQTIITLRVYRVIVLLSNPFR